ncbi:MAG TPA: 50S ribosomal protein L28 [Pirellulales bacterium]|jgi:large subunit ribosomal protein L28|nr:50S ribosomal protein L28 [Pirellulales bacterium]
MAQACEVCGKSPQRGNSITTRGKAKYLGGVGTKVTGISRREFKPNLQRIRVTVGGTNKSMRVCTQCIRSGSVTKLVRAAPFKLPTDAKSTAKAEKKSTKAPAKAPAKAKPAGKAGAAGKTGTAKS